MFIVCLDYVYICIACTALWLTEVAMEINFDLT